MNDIKVNGTIYFVVSSERCDMEGKIDFELLNHSCEHRYCA